MTAVSSLVRGAPRSKRWAWGRGERRWQPWTPRHRIEIAGGLQARLGNAACSSKSWRTWSKCARRTLGQAGGTSRARLFGRGRGSLSGVTMGQACPRRCANVFSSRSSRQRRARHRAGLCWFARRISHGRHSQLGPTKTAPFSGFACVRRSAHQRARRRRAADRPAMNTSAGTGAPACTRKRSSLPRERSATKHGHRNPHAAHAAKREAKTQAAVVARSGRQPVVAPGPDRAKVVVVLSAPCAVCV